MRNLLYQVYRFLQNRNIKLLLVALIYFLLFVLRAVSYESTIIIIIVAFFTITDTNESPNNKFPYKWLMLLVVIVALVLRFIKLGELSLWWDELITGSIVKIMRTNGLIPYFPSHLQVYWR